MNNAARRKWINIGIVWAITVLAALVMILHNNPLELPETARLKKICACLLLGLGVTIFTGFYDKLTVLPIELWQNRRIIWRLAKNDFRKRYAGSYLGTIWALVPPLVTVTMYWFVFDRIFGSGPQLTCTGGEVPYVLFLTAGLVPWFYFSDALMGAMTSLMEYNYLVKKVVFKVSVLPIIKVTAAMFVHVGFTVILMIIACIYGFTPSWYWLQLLYYTFCEYVLILGISYATCSIVIFFRDLQQLVSIVLQVGMWATPILWNIYGITESNRWFVKLNPMCYIVEGYRSCIYGEQLFWEHFYSATYFWIVTALIFVISSLIFKKLKPMFADIM